MGANSGTLVGRVPSEMDGEKGNLLLEWIKGQKGYVHRGLRIVQRGADLHTHTHTLSLSMSD